MRYFATLFLLAVYVSGIVIAKGFWSTLIAICIPLWSWYLVAEKILIVNGVL